MQCFGTRETSVTGKLSLKKCFDFNLVCFQNQLEELQQTNSQLNDQNTLLKAQLAAGATGNEQVPMDAGAVDKIAELENMCSEKEKQLELLRIDQEDLLELLTDQDIKLNRFKDKLRELGETIDGDSDDNISAESDNDNES